MANFSGFSLGLLLVVGALLSGCAAEKTKGDTLDQVRVVRPLETGGGKKLLVLDEPGVARPGVDPILLVKQTELAVTEVAESESIYFSLGSSTLGTSERSKLKHLAKRLHDDPDLQVTLLGYANDHGSRSFNLAIIDGRLNAVESSLKKLGVAIKQICKSPASADPSSSGCGSFECLRRMRRVAFVFSRREKSR